MTVHMLTRRLFVGAAVAGGVIAAALVGRQAVAQESKPDNVTSKDGTQIAFDKAGEGPALILVGGALSDRKAWAPYAELLAKKFTVVSYDRRGRGDSGDTKPYAVAREIEDLEALIDAVGGTAFVHGQSSGAVLSLEAATALPDKVTKLSLYEPPFIIDDSREPPPDDYVEHIDALIAEDKRGEAVEYFLTEVVGTPAEAVKKMRSEPMWPALEAVAHTLPYDVAILGDKLSGKPLPKDKWSAKTAPTLVMSGSESPEWIGHTAEEMAKAVPQGEYQTLDGQTHEAAPDVIVPALEKFFLG